MVGGQRSSLVSQDHGHEASPTAHAGLSSRTAAGANAAEGPRARVPAWLTPSAHSRLGHVADATLAAELGVTRETVQRTRKRLGISLHPRPQAPDPRPAPRAGRNPPRPGDRQAYGLERATGRRGPRGPRTDTHPAARPVPRPGRAAGHRLGRCGRPTAGLASDHRTTAPASTWDSVVPGPAAGRERRPGRHRARGGGPGRLHPPALGHPRRT